MSILTSPAGSTVVVVLVVVVGSTVVVVVLVVVVGSTVVVVVLVVVVGATVVVVVLVVVVGATVVVVVLVVVVGATVVVVVVAATTVVVVVLVVVGGTVVVVVLGTVPGVPGAPTVVERHPRTVFSPAPTLNAATQTVTRPGPAGTVSSNPKFAPRPKAAATSGLDRFALNRPGIHFPFTMIAMSIEAVVSQSEAQPTTRTVALPPVTESSDPEGEDEVPGGGAG